MIPSIAPDGRHAVRLRRFIGHTAANLLDVEEVTTTEGLAALAPAWDGLHERSGLAHPFLTHAFIRAYWEAFGEPGTLLVLVVRRYGQVVAIAPLVRKRTTVCGLSARAIETLRNPHVPRSDFLVSTHQTLACGAILEHLLSTGPSWDVLALSNFPEASVAYREVRRIARLAGLLTGVEDLGGSPYLERPPSWDGYVASLSAHHRSNLRNRLKRLAHEGAVSLETISGGPELKQALDDVLRLEASGWKRENGTAIRSRSATEGFYRGFAGRAAAEGWLRLQFLKVGERRVAAIYALRYEGRHFLVKLGYNPEFAKFSPGQLACLLSMEEAFEQGVREVDFLGDADPWKLEWTQSIRPHRWLCVFPEHFRARCLYVAKFGVLPRLKRTGLLRALKDALAREKEPQ